MKITVKEEQSFWTLDKVYKGAVIHAQYHSRYDQDHYKQCRPCLVDHLDHLIEMAEDTIEVIEDALYE